MQIPHFTDGEIKDIELSLLILFGPFQVLHDLDPEGNQELIVQMLQIAVKHGCHEQLLDIGLDVVFNYCRQELSAIPKPDGVSLQNRRLMAMALYYEAQLHQAIEIHRKSIQRLFDL